MSKRSLVIAAAAVVAVAVVLFVQLAPADDSDRSQADGSASASRHPTRMGAPSETIEAPRANEKPAVGIDLPAVERPAVDGTSVATAEPSPSTRERARSAGETATPAPGRLEGRAIRVRTPAPDPLSANDEAVVRQKTMSRSLEQAACRAPDVRTRYRQLAANERARMQATCAKYGIVLGE